MQLLANCGTTALSSEMLRPPGDLLVHNRLPGVSEDLASLQSVLTHEPSRTVVAIGIVVPFEDTFEALEKARTEKILKYQPLADSMRTRDYTVHADSFIEGTRGIIC